MGVLSSDVLVSVNIDGSYYTSVTIKNHTQGVTSFNVSSDGLDLGVHSMSFVFQDVEGNNFIVDDIAFNVVGELIIYASPNGTGNGSADNPTNLHDALNMVNNGGIIVFRIKGKIEFGVLSISIQRICKKGIGI